MSRKAIKEIDRQNDALAVLSAADRINRARSVTAGTAFGGLTEVIMRGDGKHLWAILQASEVIELVHQLAATVGCHIHIQPRKDFASWRQWNETSQPLLQESRDVQPVKTPRAKLAHKEQLGPKVPVRSNENVMATKKTINKRNTKRAAKTP